MYKNNNITYLRRQARQHSLKQRKTVETLVVLVVRPCCNQVTNIQSGADVPANNWIMPDSIQHLDTTDNPTTMGSAKSRKSRAKPKSEKLDQNAEQIMKWRKKGLSKLDIAGRLDVSYGTVNNWMKKNDIK